MIGQVLQPTVDVTVVIVTFNSAAVVRNCLASVPAGTPVVVVDNASGDDTPAVVRATAPGAHLIVNRHNEGFGRGAAIGLAEVSGTFGFLLNADTRLRPDTIERLHAAAARYPDAGMLAPASWTPDGELQAGRRTIFSPAAHGGPSRGPFVPAGDCCLDYVGGSSMFFRMEAYRAIGGFDDDVFLYYEDDDICHRMRLAGWSLVHVADAHLDHLAGRSTGGIPHLEWWKHWHMAWSRLHMLRKHRGRGAVMRDLAVELPGYAVKSLLYRGEKRERNAARLSGSLAWLAGRRAVDRRLGDGT